VHVPALHVPALHVPALRRSVPHLSVPHLSVPHLAGRRPALATVLLTVLYATAIAVALTSPAEHALAGCLVLTGVSGRWAVHRRRSTAGAVAAATSAVDTVLPADGVLGDLTAPAPAAAA
jgi:hypothetical protein